MRLWTWLADHSNDDILLYQVSILPSTETTVKNMAKAVIEKLGICETCGGDHAHMIDDGGNKYCPIIFFDAIRQGYLIGRLV